MAVSLHGKRELLRHVDSTIRIMNNLIDIEQKVLMRYRESFDRDLLCAIPPHDVTDRVATALLACTTFNDMDYMWSAPAVSAARELWAEISESSSDEEESRSVGPPAAVVGTNLVSNYPTVAAPSHRERVVRAAVKATNAKKFNRKKKDAGLHKLVPAVLQARTKSESGGLLRSVQEEVQAAMALLSSKVQPNNDIVWEIDEDGEVPLFDVSKGCSAGRCSTTPPHEIFDVADPMNPTPIEGAAGNAFCGVIPSRPPKAPSVPRPHLHLLVAVPELRKAQDVDNEQSLLMPPTESGMAATESDADDAEERKASEPTSRPLSCSSSEIPADVRMKAVHKEVVIVASDEGSACSDDGEPINESSKKPEKQDDEKLCEDSVAGDSESSGIIPVNDTADGEDPCSADRSGGQHKEGKESTTFEAQAIVKKTASVGTDTIELWPSPKATRSIETQTKIMRKVASVQTESERASPKMRHRGGLLVQRTRPTSTNDNGVAGSASAPTAGPHSMLAKLQNSEDDTSQDDDTRQPSKFAIITPHCRQSLLQKSYMKDGYIVTNSWKAQQRIVTQRRSIGRMDKLIKAMDSGSDRSDSEKSTEQKLACDSGKSSTEQSSLRKSEKAANFTEHPATGLKADHHSPPIQSEQFAIDAGAADPQQGAESEEVSMLGELPASRHEALEQAKELAIVAQLTGGSKDNAYSIVDLFNARNCMMNENNRVRRRSIQEDVAIAAEVHAECAVRRSTLQRSLDVVDCSVQTGLSWMDLPLDIIEWLKLNLLMREQADLYCMPWEVTPIPHFSHVSKLEASALVHDFEIFMSVTMCRPHPTKHEMRKNLRKAYRKAAMPARSSSGGARQDIDSDEGLIASRSPSSRLQRSRRQKRHSVGVATQVEAPVECHGIPLKRHRRGSLADGIGSGSGDDDGAVSREYPLTSHAQVVGDAADLTAESSGDKASQLQQQVAFVEFPLTALQVSNSLSIVRGVGSVQGELCRGRAGVVPLEGRSRLPGIKSYADENELATTSTTSGCTPQRSAVHVHDVIGLALPECVRDVKTGQDAFCFAEAAKYGLDLPHWAAKCPNEIVNTKRGQLLRDSSPNAASWLKWSNSALKGSPSPRKAEIRTVGESLSNKTMRIINLIERAVGRSLAFGLQRMRVASSMAIAPGQFSVASKSQLPQLVPGGCAKDHATVGLERPATVGTLPGPPRGCGSTQPRRRNRWVRPQSNLISGRAQCPSETTITTPPITVDCEGKYIGCVSWNYGSSQECGTLLAQPPLSSQPAAEPEPEATPHSARPRVSSAETACADSKHLLNCAGWSQKHVAAEGLGVATPRMSAPLSGANAALPGIVSTRKASIERDWRGAARDGPGWRFEGKCRAVNI
eukprot:TRINITY_DN33530_c0_g2_i1.p1 TRINITY_DN33530_c0_g2~~TRINITY_DN33530_c0_g2_i1.p1  ORF type:complete len:1455 (-),score=221.44 TRINITY_DN33530_c0_g2_i1:102-4208(-)